MSFAVPKLMRSAFTATLIALALLAGSAAAMLASCCPMGGAVPLDTTLSEAGCCGCDAVMTPVATDAAAVVKAFAAPVPVSVLSVVTTLRVSAVLIAAVPISIPAARSAPTPRRL